MRISQIRPGVRNASLGKSLSSRRMINSEADKLSGSWSAVISESSSIMGIPVEEVTPKVQGAIVALMGEVQKLRKQLEETRAQLAVAISERYGEPSSVLYFDINNFKEINDTYGHHVGDGVLIHLASIFRSKLRDTDVLGRLGGDEFGVILTHIDEAAAHEKAEELVAHTKGMPYRVANTEIIIQVAYGVYTFSAGESVDDALAAADNAMYRKKRLMKEA